MVIVISLIQPRTMKEISYIFSSVCTVGENMNMNVARYTKTQGEKDRAVWRDAQRTSVIVLADDWDEPDVMGLSSYSSHVLPCQHCHREARRLPHRGKGRCLSRWDCGCRGRETRQWREAIDVLGLSPIDLGTIYLSRVESVKGRKYQKRSFLPR